MLFANERTVKSYAVSCTLQGLTRKENGSAVSLRVRYYGAYARDYIGSL